jgi:hypothetical protein
MNIVINNFQSHLTATLGVSDTQMFIAGSLPGLTGGNTYTLTLYERDGATEVAWEIVKVTAAEDSTLTVVRGQEGTTAREWELDSLVELRLTAGQFNDKAQLQHAHAVADVTGLQTSLDTLTDAITDLDTALGVAQLGIADDLTLKADLFSPAFTGSPTAPSPTTAQGVATKAYVDAMASSGGGNVALTQMFEYTATANQTTFAATYILGTVQVFVNGLEIQSSQFTADSGTDIVLASGVTVGTKVKIVAHGGADVYNKTQIDALLLGKSDVTHTHVMTDITDMQSLTQLQALVYAAL